jgi:hypothetical protein
MSVFISPASLPPSPGQSQQITRAFALRGQARAEELSTTDQTQKGISPALDGQRVGGKNRFHAPAMKV